MANKKKGRGSASNPTIAERVDEVLRLRLKGAAFHDVVDYGVKQGWNVSERQCGRYIEKADQLLADRRGRNRSQMIALHLARRETLYCEAYRTADFRTALTVLSDLAKLQDLYSSDKDVRELIKLATEQSQRIKELEGRLNDAGMPSPGPVGEDGSPIGSSDGQAADEE